MANELSNHAFYGKDISDIDISKFIRLQRSIVKKFKSYRVKLTSKDNGVYKVYLGKNLVSSDLIINFNYTNIAQIKYGVHCYHLHGTLRENQIIIGHLVENPDSRIMAVSRSNGDYRIDTFAKHFLRIELEFMRFLS